jgi:LysR family glycine cleavage system transcriptional activator
MRDLPLVALRAFACVYETGGVRPAARLLQVSHSSVSRHLRDLEAWLGVALLAPREGVRRLAFTPQGEALGRAALASLGELAQAVAMVRERRRANSVTIAASPSVAARWLLPRLHLLGESHGWIDVSVVAEQSAMALADQEADIAIRMGAGPWPGQACTVLMDDTLYPVAQARYWNALKGATAAERLAAAKLIHDRDPNAGWERWFAAHPCPGADARAGPRLTSSDLVLRAAAQGLGVALARDRLAAEDVDAGILVRPFGDTSVALPDAYWLLTAQDDVATAARRAVVDWLTAQAGVRLPLLAMPVE